MPPLANVNGWELAYDETGPPSGAPVIMLHGILFDRSMWERQVEALSDAYRVVTVDAPGHGESPARSGFTLDDEALALGALADAIGLGPAVWVGHSMGGFKSLRVALTQPERVRGLVLVNSSAAEESIEMVPQYDAMLEVAKSDGVSADLAAVIASIMMGAEALGTEAGERWTKHFATLDGHAIEGTARAVFDRASILEHMGDVSVPTLLVHGAEDFPIPIAVARETASRISGCDVVEIAGAGHTSPVEKPSEVSAAIRAFVDRVYER